ncbi:MAG: isopentenyl-diphosphate delta-isomerase [Alphaproteobacteria bacterium]|jgi:isopentenyl-diphosphate delta-isomerase
MTYKNVILVDKNDHAIGVEEKLKAHEQGLLHRAFSIFIYKKTDHGIEFLLQQRAEEKYHCAGLWTNTCCSHPQNKDDALPCAMNRLNFEMGIQNTPLTYIDKFLYKAVCKGGITEHEMDHIFIGEFNKASFTVNADEVKNIRWITIEGLENELLKCPDMFTPWLDHVLQLVKKHINT